MHHSALCPSLFFLALWLNWEICIHIEGAWFFTIDRLISDLYAEKKLLIPGVESAVQMVQQIKYPWDPATLLYVYVKQLLIPSQ